MNDFLQELFAYNDAQNQKLIVVCGEIATQIPQKTQKLFSHLLDAHHICNARILGQTPAVGVWEVQPFARRQQMHRENTENSYQILDTQDLMAACQYANSKGKIFENSIRDILFHVINHSNYHRAQIATDFRENDLEPIVSDYIFYKREVK